MDKSFKEKKEAGSLATRVTESTGELVVSKKRFDAETGEEIEPVVNTFLKSTLEIKKAELEKELTDVNEMLEEFEDES